ncbi:MAG: FtsH protease activity modulator HflK [Acetobacteraceae bacterium]|nr:FtsH protease activity modulator HflK [Acetobacteraceae bacterium]
MSWNNGGPNPWGTPGGGGSNGGDKPPPGGPWGNGPHDERSGPRRPGGPFGGGGGPIPDLDRLIAQVQAYIRRMLPGGGGPGGGGLFGSGRGLAFLGLAVVALWLASGVYRVQPDEQGVVLRFGAVNRTAFPGLNYHLPWPFERVLRPAVTRINRTEIGYRSGAGSDTMESGRDRTGRDVLAESLMLTGDENIIDIDVAVFWRIRDAQAYLFNTRRPDDIVRAVAESSLREVIGRTPIQPALTQLRAQIETDVLHQSQEILDRYGAGVEVTQVQLQKVDPPAAVIESFRDVQRANTDAERMRNEAQSYSNDIVPRARGDAARIIAEAQGARQTSIAQATGQSERFDSVLAAYQAAKDITLRRMYIDTMQDIMSHSQALVIDDKLKGLVPFLPINLPPPGAPRPPANPSPGSQPAAAGTPSTSGQSPAGQPFSARAPQ